ncbi:INO80 complex subunit E isoform X3 [Xenopus laevis]|uniref:INO80 complex subunit E isoform X3 n=1 Tax=Xenopus laevis TaxID=8355 RepID=A0A8J1LXX2_XENLA|nr:INO80 complex subunit E isoform X3 [Xenopus laevis]
MNGQTDDEVDYKRKYKNLKRKLKFLIYEQECFQEELRRSQRKLLKVSRDKSFLLDRIMQYENVDEDSSDSDVTASSDNSDVEGGRGPSTPPSKRKRSPPAGSASPPPTSCSSGLSLHTAGGPYLSAQIPLSSSPSCGGVLPFSPRSSSLPPLSSSSKHTPTILSTVPQQMFSDGGEGSGDEGPDGDEEDDLVIDIPE